VAEFKNFRAVLGTVASDVYEVPTDTTAIVIGCQVANVDVAGKSLDFWWTDSSAADAVTYLAAEIVVPVNAAYEPVGGKLVLKAGDKLRGIAEDDDSLEVTLSVLELS
jgi:hypothetical protein